MTDVFFSQKMKLRNIKCSSFFHRDPTTQEFKCLPNDPSCSSYKADFTCKTCYPGWALSGGTCVVQQSNQQLDPYCSKFSLGVCTACFKGYYTNNQNRCQVANSQCKTSQKNLCLSCYGGYLLVNHQCIDIQTIISTLYTIQMEIQDLEIQDSQGALLLIGLSSTLI